ASRCPWGGAARPPPPPGRGAPPPASPPLPTALTRDSSALVDLPGRRSRPERLPDPATAAHARSPCYSPYAPNGHSSAPGAGHFARRYRPIRPLFHRGRRLVQDPATGNCRLLLADRNGSAAG